jgi:hypothetical protein
MDSDEFDDDILDEDLIAAATQASSDIHRPPTRVPNGFNSQQRVGAKELAHKQSTAIEMHIIDSCFLDWNRFGKCQYCFVH